MVWLACHSTDSHPHNKQTMPLSRMHSRYMPPGRNSCYRKSVFFSRWAGGRKEATRAVFCSCTVAPRGCEVYSCVRFGGERLTRRVVICHGRLISPPSVPSLPELLTRTASVWNHRRALADTSSQVRRPHSFLVRPTNPRTVPRSPFMSVRGAPYTFGHGP